MRSDNLNLSRGRTLERSAVGPLVLLAPLTLTWLFVSHPAPVAAATTLTVNSTGDAVDSAPGDGACDAGGGVCTLRAAIQESNALAGTDTIAFSIGGGGAQTITLTSALPVITDAVVLDGSSQPGFGGTPLIEIDAGTTTAAVLKIRAGPANVHDLAVRTPHTAIRIHNVTNSTFANLDLSWTGATRSGMGLAVGSSSNNTFTQVTASSRNTGIQISESSSNNVVRCAALLANGLGVDVSGIGSGNLVGESYIAGNVGAGLQNTSLQLVTAESNYWGAPDGPDPLGSGDTISGNVDVVPFLTQLPACLQDLQVEITSAPDDPVQIGVEISVEAAFTDGVTSGPHSAVWEWGDTSSSAGIVAEADGVGTVSGAYTYTASGVYTLTVTVTNDFGVVVSDVFEFIVVYDPEGGFVTGAGWIDSPAGAYTRDLTLEGRANFGFVSKYKRGASVPTGQTTFQFSVAGLHFRSTEYEWLVVAGARAQYKGSGTINGQGDYGFLLTALDGDINGGAGPDSFRIKIWDRATDQIVYDNQPEADDPGSAATELDGGSIVIHRG